MSVKPFAPWPSFSAEEIEAVHQVLASGKTNYWTGTEGVEFEREFANLCSQKYAIALANGTLALELALEAGGIGVGDDVIVTPRTFIASVSCIVRRGGRPVFADVSPHSQNITPESVKAALTPQTRAIIAVHHAGWPCEMDGLMELAQEYNLLIIEDCAQAHGAKYKGRPVGGLGHVAAFSFCQDKVMTTGGEGGMLVTSDEDLWRRVWSLKDHGKGHDAVNAKHPIGFRWLNDVIGTNARLTEMQSAIGRIQIRKLPKWHKRRAENADRMSKALCQYPVIRIPEIPDHIDHGYYRLYAFVVPEALADGWTRDRIMEELDRTGLQSSVGSCPEVYNEKAFDSDSLRPKRPLPVAQELGKTSLAFLVHPTLSNQEIDRMCTMIGTTLSMASR